MRILFAVPRYHTNHCGLVEGLLQAGHQVAFFASKQSSEEYHHPDVHFLYCPDSLATLPQILRAAAKFKPDLIILREISLKTLALSLFAKAKGAAALYYDQSPLDFDRKAGHYLPYRMLSLYRALRCFGLMPRNRITTAYGPPIKLHSNGDFIPFAVSVSPHAENREYSSELPIKIMSIGKFSQARKNHSLLLNALLPELKAGQVHLTILGVLQGQDNPHYQALLQMIAAEGITNAITIQSNLSYQQCRDMYDAHDLFILPSSREPAAISPLEAMAAGLPVICSTENGTNYCIVESENGFLFKADDEADLRAVLQRFIQAPEKIRQMGQSSLKRVKENYLPQYFAQRLAAIYARHFG